MAESVCGIIMSAISHSGLNSSRRIQNQVVQFTPGASRKGYEFERLRHRNVLNDKACA